jgi:hypothetical protein
MSYHDDSGGIPPRTPPWPDPARPTRTSVRQVVAAVGTLVVAKVTIVAVFLGMMSPMATGSCGPESTEPHCVNEHTYAALLTLGSLVLGAAVLSAVWIGATGRPRLVWFAPWAPLLVAIFLVAHYVVAGGELF